MGSLHTLSAPPPALFVTGSESPVTNAYFAVSIEAAVDLLAAPRYKDLRRPQRLARARGEQQRFLEGFFDPALGAALDLRIIADPGARTPVSMALVGRVWGGTGVTARAEELRQRVHAALPGHVTGTPVESAHAVDRLLQPFHGATMDSAVIARHELIGQPNRPDAGVKYYYSAVPFNSQDDDWSAVYSALAASPVPVVLSVAVLPMQVPAQFARTLRTLATFYGRMARPGETRAGLYQTSLRLAPDAFAVDAEKTFHDYSRRLAQQAFALRIQVSAAGHLPAGLVETIAGAISAADAPAEQGGSLLVRQRATSACEVRRPGSVPERRLAEYNLNVIDFRMLTGRAEIWGRPDPPDPQLAMLTVLGDVRDAGCAFRFPIAVDGSVPGFRVERGQSGRFGQSGTFGQSVQPDQPDQLSQPEPDQATGPVIRLGPALLGPRAGADRAITLPVQSLTRHTLICGAPGSGKTTTAIEMLRQLWTGQQIPFLVIDPVNANTDEYRKLAGEPGFEALEVITVGDEGGRPLRFNPFEVPPGVVVGAHSTNLLACFTAAFGLVEPLRSGYRDALNLTYLRSGILPAERPDGAKRTWPTVVEFLAAMREVTGSLPEAGEVRAGARAETRADIGADIGVAAVRGARQLVRGVAASAFLTDQPNDVGRLFDHPVILELTALGSGDEQALMMALLLTAITGHFRSERGAGTDLRHVTVVEEAHRLLGRAPGGGSPVGGWRGGSSPNGLAGFAGFAGILAENRKYGSGVIITEQIPGKVAADAVKNVNLKIVHRLTATDDLRYLGETMGMDEQQRVRASRLRPGEALLYGDDWAEAVQVSISRAPRAPGVLAGATGLAGAAVPAAVALPFAACDRCRAQCEYRGAALSMVSDPRTVDGIGRATDAAGQPGRSPAEQQSALFEVASLLFRTVGRFAALPSAAPGRNDAAYCLLLHALAAGGRHSAAQWPEAAARLLGITPGAAPGPGWPAERGGSLLEAADDAAQQLETGADGPHDPLEDR